MNFAEALTQNPTGYGYASDADYALAARLGHTMALETRAHPANGRTQHRATCTCKDRNSWTIKLAGVNSALARGNQHVEYVAAEARRAR